MSSCPHPLKLKRVAAGYTQKELAAAAQCSHQSISGIERRARSASLRTRVRLARALNCAVEEITDPSEAD